MGSDDLFHKRRNTSNKKLEREKAKRDPYDRILIVCEGEKTEPDYLRELIDYLKLNSANVEVDGNCDSSPDKILTYAKKCYNEEIKKGEAYDKVYCVFDKDSHTTYDATVLAIRGLKPKATYQAITSVPCFEYWVLLHYNYITRPFVRTETKSPCDSVIDELKTYMPAYKKGDKGVFNEIMKQTDFAVANSLRACEQAKQTDTDNPTTLMHELIEYLRNLKD